MEYPFPYLAGPGVPAFQLRCPCPNCYAGPFVLTANILLGIVDPVSAAFVKHQLVHIAGSPQVLQCSICQNYGCDNPTYFESMAALVVHLQVHDATMFHLRRGKATRRTMRPGYFEQRYVRNACSSGRLRPVIVCPICSLQNTSERAILRHLNTAHTIDDHRRCLLDSSGVIPYLRRLASLTDFTYSPMSYMHRFMRPTRDYGDNTDVVGLPWTAKADRPKNPRGPDAKCHATGHATGPGDVNYTVTGVSSVTEGGNKSAAIIAPGTKRLPTDSASSSSSELSSTLSDAHGPVPTVPDDYMVLSTRITPSYGFKPRLLPEDLVRRQIIGEPYPWDNKRTILRPFKWLKTV